MITLIRYVSGTVTQRGLDIQLTALSPFASSVFAPAVSDANRTFHNMSQILSSLSVTAYLFGYFVSLPSHLREGVVSIAYSPLLERAIIPLASE